MYMYGIYHTYTWICNIHGICMVYIIFIGVPDVGGELDLNFLRATEWYFLSIKRRQHHLIIQKPTSVDQKLPDGWQKFWRNSVSEIMILIICTDNVPINRKVKFYLCQKHITLSLWSFTSKCGAHNKYDSGAEERVNVLFGKVKMSFFVLFIFFQ